MKHAVCVAILICMATLTLAADNGKTVRVDRTKFSEVYPAVWFSPSTGEIAPLKEKSERPPARQYEIWIEPGDPEFGIMAKGLGFALIGEGNDAFTNPSIPDDPALKRDITHLMKEYQARDQLVFYCEAKSSTCLIMVTSMDSKEEVIRFKWRLLTKDKKVSDKAVDGDKNATQFPALRADLNGDGEAGYEDAQVSTLRADLNGDGEEDFLDVFLLRRNEKEMHPSIAVVSLNHGGYRDPIQTFSHPGRFTGMFQVRAVNLDDEDQRQEVLLGRYSAGTTHIYLDVQIFKINDNEDGLELVKEKRFQDQSLSDITKDEF